MLSGFLVQRWHSGRVSRPPRIPVSARGGPGPESVSQHRACCDTTFSQPNAFQQPPLQRELAQVLVVVNEWVRVIAVTLPAAMASAPGAAAPRSAAGALWEGPNRRGAAVACRKPTQACPEAFAYIYQPHGRAVVAW